MNQSSPNAMTYMASADSHGLLLWFFLVIFEAWMQKRKLKNLSFWNGLDGITQGRRIVPESEVFRQTIS